MAKAKANAKATTSKKRSKTSSRKKSRKRTALPARAAKAALDRATQDIRSLRKKASKNAWAIGRRLAQVAELELHKARGFPNIEAYAESQLAISRDRAFLYMRVAQAFSETVAATFGAEKLDRALRYIAATPEHEEPKDIPKLQIRIPGEDGAPAKKKRFTQATIADLRSAVQAERAGANNRTKQKRTAPKWLEEEAATALESGHKALDKAVGRTAAKTADLTVRRDGEDVLVDVRGIPLEKAAAAFRALASALKP